VTGLVDVHGDPIESGPIPRRPKSCPKCGSKRLETVSGFGGHWETLCMQCGSQAAAGTGNPED
jgi:hypothetical protein